MCGISGFIDYNKHSSEVILTGMSDSLYHRGPDGSGSFFKENSEFQIGLGHRRLSIIDLSDGGHQPMQFKQFTITFNGEIYNYIEVRDELIKTGRTFVSNSDTEVILQAFDQWGIKCIDRFIGMFAFVIYDSVNHELICVRDRAGVKPFFYYWHQNLFLFASELKAFHKHPSFKKEINMNAVAAFMQYGNIPTPHCIFINSFKLRPGHYLKFNLNSRELSELKYWDVYDAYNKPKLNIGFEEAKRETEKVLSSAFQYRMVADVPVGVFLSGGYDSTCLTALLSQSGNEKLKTFTIGVPDIGLDEAPFAKQIAAHFNTDHTEYYCTEKEAIDIIPTLPDYYDEPFGDQSAIPTTLVSRMARKDVTVALSADAGDEVFAGYNRYDYIMKQGKLLNRTPKVIRYSAYSLMKAVPAQKIPVLRKKYNFHNRYEKLKMLLTDPSSENIMLSLSKQFLDKDLKKLFLPDIEHLKTAYASRSLKNEFYSPLSYMMAIDYQTYLLDDILQKVDRASMSASLEAREPFLDYRVIEWAAQLPDGFKYNNGEKKYILKEITHQYIPKALMDRPKMGFAIPIENWLTFELKDQVLTYLDKNRLKNQGIFNEEEMQEIVKDFYSGRKEFALKIWYALMFQLWYDKWMK